MARAKGISKAQGYLARVFTVEYDLAGMINAYGAEYVIWLTQEIAAGRIDARQCVDRWSAHVALTQDYTLTDSMRVKLAGREDDYHMQQEETV